jgi:DNA-binding response OmpR family regulator
VRARTLAHGVPGTAPGGSNVLLRRQRLLRWWFSFSQMGIDFAHSIQEIQVPGQRRIRNLGNRRSILSCLCGTLRPLETPAVYKVLIVEDDPQINRKLSELIATIPDTAVTQAYDRASAEEALKSTEFALLVADVRLGESAKDRLSGFSLLRTIGDKPTVAIIVSGMPEDMLPEMAISMQAFDFISKPINDLDFINKAEHALKAHEELRKSNGAHAGTASWPADLKQDPRRKLHLRWKDRAVLLTLTELRLVHCLLETPNQTVPYAKLAQQLKTPTDNPKTIATHMAGVKKRFLDVDEKFDGIDNDPGAGYIWRIPSA